jgi:glycosyltransferase involved in cell wall biosynthesis
MRLPSVQSRSAPASSPTILRAPNVLLAGRWDALESPGGGEVQMLSTVQSLSSVGVRGRLWRPWEDRIAEADCLHLFGSTPEHLRLVELAHRHNVPVVLSPIAWFDLASSWREPSTGLGRVSAAARFLARAACPGLSSWRRRLYHEVDLLLPNSKAEANQLIRYFRVPSGRIHVVPNGADPSMAEADPRPFRSLISLSDYVLCPGRIEPRKNQLGLLRALRETNVPVVILGDVVPGHEAYLAQCLKEAGPRVEFVHRLEHDDPLLASAYAGCGCLALASWFETPGLVALEAGMSGIPLVLPIGGCAQEYFGDLALYVAPDDLSGIRQAVLTALARERSRRLADHVRKSFSWQAVAQITRDAYEKVL